VFLVVSFPLAFPPITVSTDYITEQMMEDLDKSQEIIALRQKLEHGASVVRDRTLTDVP
jgi:hypothetical protein